MNKLKYLVWHCSATQPRFKHTANDIVRWHEARWGNGKRGYRSVIELNGKIEPLVKANMNSIVEPNEVTWGAKGINSFAHHFCYIGGLDDFDNMPSDTRTEAQKQKMEYITNFYIKYMNPNIKVVGHNEFSNKACPSFIVADWCREIGISEKNILDNDKYGYREYFEYLERLRKKK